MGRAARPLHDSGNHRAIERGSNLQAARRGGLIKPAKPDGRCYRIRLVWGFFCQAVVLGLLSVLCSEREGRSSSRRLAIRFAERAEGVKGPKRQRSLAACRLASLVFRSALTPEHAEGR